LKEVIPVPKRFNDENSEMRGTGERGKEGGRKKNPQRKLAPRSKGEGKRKKRLKRRFFPSFHN